VAAVLGERHEVRDLRMQQRLAEDGQEHVTRTIGDLLDDPPVHRGLHHRRRAAVHRRGQPRDRAHGAPQVAPHHWLDHDLIGQRREAGIAPVVLDEGGRQWHQ
jgi:hypothetical protein